MIEVGAARPDYLSISKSFRERGWQIIAVEPNPAFCEEHRALGHEILQYACGDEDRDDVDFYVVDSNAAQYLDGKVSFESFSSLGIVGEFAKDLKRSRAKPTVSTIKVQVRRLDTLLQANFPTLSNVDLLAVDVEGWELSVMRGFDTGRFRPEVIILENLFKSGAYHRFMRQRGYRRWLRLKPNEAYVRKDLLPHPILDRIRRLFRGNV